MDMKGRKGGDRGAKERERGREMFVIGDRERGDM